MKSQTFKSVLDYLDALCISERIKKIKELNFPRIVGEKGVLVLPLAIKPPDSNIIVPDTVNKQKTVKFTHHPYIGLCLESKDDYIDPGSIVYLRQLQNKDMEDAMFVYFGEYLLLFPTGFAITAIIPAMDTIEHLTKIGKSLLVE